MERSLLVSFYRFGYALYLDGTVLAKNGVVGTSRENSRPGYFPQVVEFHAREDHVELILQASSFDHRRGTLFNRFSLPILIPYGRSITGPFL
ncbi:hypothetical protein [Sediminispirochaeta bajacaliforniensis]|uniref:hypothetical protein n=1 Tax=Sediminispirochaeta bajacaliforniensis TaxID=148 RepID=UPI00037F384C|nr:hypothetical protein [Sediminispirochaeta bajacaliforniensis]